MRTKCCKNQDLSKRSVTLPFHYHLLADLLAVQDGLVALGCGARSGVFEEGEQVVDGEAAFVELGHYRIFLMRSYLLV